MTKEGFKEYIVSKGTMTREYLDKEYGIQPCDCEEEGCKGWAIGPHDGEFEEKP